MRIIKVDATPSTNAFLRGLYRENPGLKNCCVTAFEQTKGKGQRGTVWQSEKGKNLTCSVLFNGLNLKAENYFQLSLLTSLALVETLENLKIEDIRIKWPNDILSGNHKIGGALIENTFKNDRITASLIGVGLNINQENFEDLPQAASLKMLTGKAYDVEEILLKLLYNLQQKMKVLKEESFAGLWQAYHRALFKKDVPATFQTPAGKQFNGIIQQVLPDGRLRILLENEEVKDFEMKTIRLLY